MDKDKIPHGVYCYTYKDGKQVNCPFWARDDEHGYQNNGYCSYLKKGDWEEDSTFSLLWDQVKECGENMDDGEVL